MTHEPNQPSEPEKDEPRNSHLAEWGKFYVILAELFGLSGAGLWLGHWLSSAHGFPSWTLVITAGLGLSLAIFRLITIHGRTPQ